MNSIGVGPSLLSNRAHKEKSKRKQASTDYSQVRFVSTIGQSIITKVRVCDGCAIDLGCVVECGRRNDSHVRFTARTTDIKKRGHVHMTSAQCSPQTAAAASSASHKSPHETFEHCSVLE